MHINTFSYFIDVTQRSAQIAIFWFVFHCKKFNILSQSFPVGKKSIYFYVWSSTHSLVAMTFSSALIDDVLSDIFLTYWVLLSFSLFLYFFFKYKLLGCGLVEPEYCSLWICYNMIYSLVIINRIALVLIFHFLLLYIIINAQSTFVYKVNYCLTTPRMML